MTDQTKVIFRKWPDGDILALFPDIQEHSYFCSSYQHIGQHCSAEYGGCISSTVPATQDEYRDL